jgi:hypothetical protein
MVSTICKSQLQKKIEEAASVTRAKEQRNQFLQDMPKKEIQYQSISRRKKAAPKIWKYLVVKKIA